MFTSSEHHLLSLSSLDEFQEAFDYFFHEQLSPNLSAEPDLLRQITPQFEHLLLGIASAQSRASLESFPQPAILVSDINPSLQYLFQPMQSHFASCFPHLGL